MSFFHVHMTTTSFKPPLTSHLQSTTLFPPSPTHNPHTTQAALALKILKGAYKPITGYSADLTAIIDRCLCTRRAARPDTDKLLVLPSVQAWAGKLHLELPLVAVPRRIMGNGGVGVGGGGGWGQHGRSASWSPVGMSLCTCVSLCTFVSLCTCVFSMCTHDNMHAAHTLQAEILCEILCRTHKAIKSHLII